MLQAVLAPTTDTNITTKTAIPQWRYILYVRKSSEPDDRQVLSLPAQKQELTKAFGHLQIVEIVEESQSAKAPGRPKFNAMLQAIQKGKADGIIAWHPDRLARNSVDGGRIIYDLDQNKIKDLKFAQYTFENTPEGKWMLNIIFGQSKYFVDKLSVDVRRGLSQKLQMGWRPGVAPIGYLNNLADTKGTRTIVPDPERFPIVKQMWDLMLTGAYTVPRILQIANEEWGLRTVERKKIGGSPFSHAGVYRMFTSPFYYGMFEYSGKLYQGHHLPMITEDQFWKVQKLLGRNGRPRPKSKRHFAYTGLLRCGECGCMITAEEKTKVIRTTGEERTYVYYRCTKKSKTHNCSQHYIEVNDLEAQVCQALLLLSVSDEFLDWALKYLKEMYSQETATERQRFQTLEKACQSAERQLDELLNVRIKGLIDDEEYEAKRLQLTREKNTLRAQMEDPDGVALARLELAERTCQFAHNLIYRFKNGSLDEKRIILEKVGSNRLLHDMKFSFEPVKPYCFFANSSENSDWRGIVEDVRTFCVEATQN
jgi:site-specific DNA recombinase